MHILLYIDDLSAAEQAIQLLINLNYPVDTDITLISVYEIEKEQPHLELIQNQVKARLVDKYSDINMYIRSGHVIDHVVQEAATHTYDLVITGTEEHQGLLHLRYDSFPRKLSKGINVPFLIARNVPDHISKVLFCTSAELPSLETLRIGGRLFSGLDIEVGLLHVMSQLALRPDSVADDLLDTAETAIQRNTHEGIHLSRGLQMLKTVGINGKITPRLRHGLVIEQVLAEIEEGHYDLVVIGEHYRQGLNRWYEVLLDDIAGQLLGQSPRSILTV
jgi:nucleotide-binding universal stress UspA family protein